MKKNIASKLSNKILIAGTLIWMAFANLGCSVLQDLGKDIDGLSEYNVKVTYRGFPDPSASAHMDETRVYPLIPPYH